MYTLNNKNQFVRSPDGWVTGLCQGFAESFDLNVGLVRILVFVSIMFFGVGLIPYIAAYFCFPVRGRESAAYESRIMGVCLRISERFSIEVGVVRFLAIMVGLSSFGVTVIGYFLLHFILLSQDA